MSKKNRNNTTGNETNINEEVTTGVEDMEFMPDPYANILNSTNLTNDDNVGGRDMNTEHVNFNNIGEDPAAAEQQNGGYDTNMSYDQYQQEQQTEVARFLTNNKVYGLIIGVNKDDLLRFAEQQLPIMKRTGYTEMKQSVFSDLLKGVDANDFNNAKRTYFPSTNKATTMGEGVKSIITMQIADATLQLAEGNQQARNIVDLSRSVSNFAIERLLNHFDVESLFSKYIPTPHKRYENQGVTEVYVNTTMVLLAYLGITLETTSSYNFTVKEIGDKFLVELKLKG